MATAATQEILQEDGAEEALAALARDVREAEKAIRALLHVDKSRKWTVRELQDAANDHSWSSSVMSIAFFGLLKAGVLKVDDDLQVRAV